MMHFGTYVLNPDVVDYIKLNGDGSYDVYLYDRRKNVIDNIPQPVLHVDGPDADSLREWIGTDKRQGEIENELNEVHLKDRKKT